MNDAVYAPPKSDLSEDVMMSGDEVYYIVSPGKFAILFLATLGLYQLYWFWRNWRGYKRACKLEGSSDADIWPIPRAIFAVFFIHSLFRNVVAYANEKQRSLQWEFQTHATILVVLLLASNVLGRMAGKSIGSPWSDVLSLIVLFPLCYVNYRAQIQINAACGDPNGDSNKDFTGANYAWTILGTIIWILAAIGTFMPEMAE